MHARNIKAHPRAELVGVYDVFAKAAEEGGNELGAKVLGSVDEALNDSRDRPRLHRVFHRHPCRSDYPRRRQQIRDAYASYIEARRDLGTPDTVGLLFDTGHFTFAGDDPAAVSKKWAKRINHVHTKDIRPDVMIAEIG